ncbi:MAG TPA: M1 family peptidase, partial [Flavisolibacter sp.]|nr:M1 family peptidase [Flavisolibacter sp.]
MKTKYSTLTAFLFLFCTLTNAQHRSVTHLHSKEHIPVNTLPARTWWNLLHYAIHIIPDYETRFITGTNTITFFAQQAGATVQIDSQEPMRITKITRKGAVLAFQKEKNAYIIAFPQEIKKHETETITIHFEGHPQTAVNPPFDNGWIWAKDKEGRPWMSVACQGSGASIWLPCKDVLYDEPDKGVTFSIKVPDTLVAVANGRLQKRLDNNDGSVTYLWKVQSPINNYNIIPYIGKYVTWQKKYTGMSRKLDCDFWVMDYSLDRSKQHLKQVDTMIRSYEYWLGPYPFYKDGY